MRLRSRHVVASRLVFAALGLAVGAAGCDVRAVPGTGLDSESLLEERAGLEVTVSDEGGAPLAGAWVTLSPGAWEQPTGDDGVARFEAVGGGDWVVTASAQGFDAASGAISLGEEDGALALTLVARAEAGTTLAGEVLDREGLAVAGAEIRLGETLVATTGEDGSFEATNLEAGTFEATVTPPDGSGLLSWEIATLDLEEDARAEIAVILGPATAEGSTYVGTRICLACHATMEDSYGQSPHRNAGRDTEDVEDDDDLDALSDAFLGGDTVTLDDLGASVALASADGVWTATLTDAWGDSTGALEVVEVYGGHRTGAALAVEVGGTQALLPVAWALAGQGLSSQQDEAGWVSAWSDGWFDGEGRLSLDSEGRPGVEASFALQCAGCHATDGVLVASGGAYTLDHVAEASSLETVVGCESCHGPGSVHYRTVSKDDILNPASLPPEQRLELCARCHERATPDDHPFTDTPGYPVDGDGGLLGPLDPASELSTSASVRWLSAPASRVGWDQAGDLRSSPHLAGEQGYAAICEDCHDPHGGGEGGLRVELSDNALCTTCHAADFPDEAAEASHARHGSFHPGEWTPGSCVGCHMPRLGHSVRPDAVSGAGELRAHVLDFVEPAAALAEFDAAGASTLPLGQVPTNACLDCHLQSDAEEEDAGSNCPCPVGSPTKRVTYEDFQSLYETVWGLE